MDLTDLPSAVEEELYGVCYHTRPQKQSETYERHGVGSSLSMACHSITLALRDEIKVRG